MNTYLSRVEMERDAKLNRGQPLYEAEVWRHAELDEGGKVVRGNLIAQISYHPRTGTFYLTKNDPRGGDEFAYGDRFEVPLKYYLDKLAYYTGRKGLHVVTRMDYPWRIR